MRLVVKHEPDVYEPYRKAARARHRVATPYRLGIAVALAGDDLPSPYAPGSRGDKVYQDGIKWGRQRREHEERVATQAIEGDK